jgi:hypothetical protein
VIGTSPREVNQATCELAIKKLRFLSLELFVGDVARNAKTAYLGGIWKTVTMLEL